jgi:hypothetical protein
MQGVAFIVVVLASSLSFADEPADQIVGSWNGVERGIACDMKKDSNGLYSGTVTAADHAKEIGQQIFKNLKYQADSKNYKGQFSRPDEPTDIVDVTVTIERNTLKAVVKKFIFSKTLVFTRKETAATKEVIEPKLAR